MVLYVFLKDVHLEPDVWGSCGLRSLNVGLHTKICFTLL